MTRKPNYQSVLLLTVAVLMCLNTATAIIGFNAVAKQIEARTEYERLRSGILYTNLRIRDAALSGKDADLHLHRIDSVRAESLAALEYMRTNKSRLQQDQQIVIDQIFAERMKYRTIQTGVIDAIRHRSDQHDMWVKLQNYDLYMTQYVDRCDVLITFSNNNIVSLHTQVISQSITVTAISVITITSLIVLRWRWRLKMQEVNR